MSGAADLSVFSFERGVEEEGTVEQVAVKRVVAPVVPDNKQTQAPRRALDLENLTPETLEAFFPSERPVAA